MSFPINLQIGALQISSHLLFETLAFLIGFRYYLGLRKREKDLLSADERVWILIAVCVGALLGSRFIAVMEHIHLVTLDTPLLFFYSQKTIVGGLLGGLVAVEATKKILGIKSSSGDIMTYPLILGIIIGRIGCFLAGLEDGTYGIETTLIWGIDFGDGVLRHPTQIYEIIFLIFLWILIKKIEKGNLFCLTANGHFPDGLRFKLFLGSYLFFRFFIEFLKPIKFFWFSFSFIQISCLIGLLYYIWQLRKVFVPKDLF